MVRASRHVFLAVLAACTPRGGGGASEVSSSLPAPAAPAPDAGIAPGAPAGPFVSADGSPFGPVVACPPRAPKPRPPALIELARKGLAAPVVDQLTADLDGDGTVETIRVHAPPSRHARGFGDIVVAIGQDAYWVGSGAYEGARVIDLDPRDRSREVVLDRAFDGAVLGYEHGRIVMRDGLSRMLPQATKRSDQRASFARIGDETVVLVEVGAETVRARLPAYLCGATLGVLGIELDPSGRHRDWLVEIAGRGPLPSDGQQFSTYLVVSHGPAGLAATGPFVAASSARVTAPGQLEVTYWDCGVRHRETWTRAAGGLAKVAERRTGQRVPALCGPAQLLDADLDGDGGDETIVVRDGVVAVDGHVIARTSTWASEVRGQIVDVDTRDPRKELVVTHSADEDIETSYLYTYDGKALRESPAIASRLVIDGGGEVRATVGSCGYPIHEQTWALSGGRLRKLREVQQPATPPGECSACPFVDVERAGGGWTRVGEILRELRRPQDQTWQALAIPAGGVAGERVRLRLAEEKPETTHLDAVHLLIDGFAVRPVACSSAAPPSYCEEDRVFTILPEGTTLILEFELPPGSSHARLELRASGYYLPHATTDASR